MLTLKGLNNAIKVEWENLEQNLIDNALKCWAKHFRLIYYAHGSHIEHRLQQVLKNERRKRFVFGFKINGMTSTLRF